MSPSSPYRVGSVRNTAPKREEPRSERAQVRWGVVLVPELRSQAPFFVLGERMNSQGLIANSQGLMLFPRAPVVPPQKVFGQSCLLRRWVDVIYNLGIVGLSCNRKGKQEHHYFGARPALNHQVTGNGIYQWPSKLKYET